MRDPGFPAFVFMFWAKIRGAEFNLKGFGCWEAWRAAETMRDTETTQGNSPIALVAGRGSWEQQVRGLKGAILDLERAMKPVPMPPIPPDVVMDALLDRDPDGMRRSSFLAFKGRSQWFIERGPRSATVYQWGKGAMCEFDLKGTGRTPYFSANHTSIEVAKAVAREWVLGDS